MARYFARVTRGIEWVAAAEVAGTLDAEIIEIGHREVHFTTSAPPRDLLSLRCVDDVFVHVATVPDVGRHRSSLRTLERMPTTGAAGALATVGSTRRLKPSDRFVVTGSALGRRNFNRYEIEDAVGGALAVTTGGRYLSRSDHERPPATPASYRVHLRDDIAIVGLRLAETALHRRAYKTATTVGTLHPPVAAALVLVVGVVPGATSLDPFCGSGTLLAERVALDPSGRAWGSDLAYEAVATTAANLASLGPAAAVARADAARLPFATASVDAVVTNPPWDRRLAIEGAGRDDPAVVWREIARVLRPDGRLVVLSEEEIPPIGDVAVFDLGGLSVSGSRPRLQVMTGPTGDASPLPPPGALLADELRRFAGHLVDPR